MIALMAILAMFIVAGTFLAVIELADFWMKREKSKLKTCNKEYELQGLIINKQ